MARGSCQPEMLKVFEHQLKWELTAACGLSFILVIARRIANPKGPCTHIAYTLGPMYLYREYFKANVYTR